MPSFLKTLGRFRFTAITGVNTLFNGMLNNKDFKDLDFTNLKFTLGGGTAVQANNIYLFDGIRWKQVVDNNRLQSATAGFNESILGYTPVKSADKATITTAPGGATVTLLGCKTNPANGHVYCAYQLSTGTNFYNTFNLAKQIGGYLVTMTSHDERIWVNTNIIRCQLRSFFTCY